MRPSLRTVRLVSHFINGNPIDMCRPLVHLPVHITPVLKFVIPLPGCHHPVRSIPSASFLARAVVAVSLARPTSSQPAANIQPPHSSHPVRHAHHPFPPALPLAPSPSHVATSAKRPATGTLVRHAPNKLSAPVVAALQSTSLPAVNPSSRNKRNKNNHPPMVASSRAPSSSATSPAKRSAPVGGTNADASAARSRSSNAAPSLPDGATPHNSTLTTHCTSVTCPAVVSSRAAITAARTTITRGRVGPVRGECLRSLFVRVGGRCWSHRSSAGRACGVCIRVRGRRRRVDIHMSRMCAMRGRWSPARTWRTRG